MLKEKVRITNKLGMHARSANKLIKLAQSFDATVTLSNGVDQADATSMVDLLILAATLGTELEIIVEGVDKEDEEDALHQVIALFKNKFDEGE